MRGRAFIPTAMLLAAMGSPTHAEYPVIDTTAIGKLTDQLNKMQEQIKMLTEMRDRLQAQIDAIGRMGQIRLPTLNVARIGARLRQDMQCLKPDLSKLMPNVEFEEIGWGSICQASSAYRQTLFINPEDLVGLPSWGERQAARQAVTERRRNVLEDAAAKGLAQGDIAANDVEHLNKAADDLEAGVTSAQTSNDRLAAIAQGQVVLARALAQQNQILAQLLKVQSAFAIQAGVRVQSDLVDPSGDREGSGP